MQEIVKVRESVRKLKVLADEVCEVMGQELRREAVEKGEGVHAPGEKFKELTKLFREVRAMLRDAEEILQDLESSG